MTALAFQPEDLSEAALIAARESTEYFQRAMLAARPVQNHEIIMAAALGTQRPQGMICEFGVATGRTINFIAQRAPNDKIYGFDSFEGLPEDWRAAYRAGAFAQAALPRVLPNVELIKGWFDDTAPAFARTHEGPVAFMHIDCDLYSSTKTIFDALDDRLVPGSLIVFDEYLNYPGWRDHEFKAFQEWVTARGATYQYLGYVPYHQQVVVRIASV